MDPDQPDRKKRRVEQEQQQQQQRLVATMTASQQEVFTAVPMGEGDVEQQQQQQAVEEDSLMMVAPSTSLSKYKAYSLFLGLLIGVFIQFSSLGANFLVEQLLVVGGGGENHPHMQWWFSLVWSLVTSTIGVLLLVALRSLLQTTNHYADTNTSSTNHAQHHQHQLLLILECYFAAGALTGVCVAWMGTDVVLQAPQHLKHSCVTLVLALGWCKLLAACFPVLEQQQAPTEDTTADTDDSLNEPLLPQQDTATTTTVADGAVKQSPSASQPPKPKTALWVQCTSLFLGSLIGVFIQFSSLGANFLMQQLHRDALAAQMTFSLGWSVATSCMGVAVLFLVRALLLLQQPPLQEQTVLITVECFFATGAVVGLNLAWTATDVVLGLESHVTSSVLTLAATLLWCKMVLFCCGYCRREEDN